MRWLQSLWESYYRKGFEEGKKQNLLLVSLEEEAHFALDEEPHGKNPMGKFIFPHTETGQLKELVLSPLYPALRKLLMFEAMSCYRDARLKQKPEERMIMDDRGNHTLDIVKALDNLKPVKVQPTEDDWT